MELGGRWGLIGPGVVLEERIFGLQEAKSTHKLWVGRKKKRAVEGGLPEG